MAGSKMHYPQNRFIIGNMILNLKSIFKIEDANLFLLVLDT